MSKIRFGVIGIGQMGRVHIQSIQRNKNAEVIAICARTAAKVEAIQNEFDIPYGYTDVDALLGNEEIDAIVIATGSDTHKEYILKSLAAQKHIFCEKPLAKTLSDCKIIEEEVAKHGDLAFTVAFMRRFDPSYVEAKAKIKAGEIGAPILYKGVGIDPASVLPGHLEGVKAGIYVPWFIEMGSHDADLARWFLEGEPVESFATGDAYVCKELADYNDYDNGFSLTKFDNNTTAYIQVGRTGTCSQCESEIVGTKGTIRVNSIPRKNYLSQFKSEGFVEECQDDFLHRWADAYIAEMNDFVDCVTAGTKPATTVHDGTKGLEFCLQLHEAYLRGTSVR
ncbi:MAG: Gfo/Idh/MocA family oxidoreductase [Clostridiales Family XIII bacterium]|jgi:myo-inositol 2-dehydrogenase/D-chiro-inositol 1-dehydrogenase|nr:Gfo/Idh/MocA family oxidoreductase [Clostridiales Family XIII bacterium]